MHVTGRITEGNKACSSASFKGKAAAESRPIKRLARSKQRTIFAFALAITVLLSAAVVESLGQLVEPTEAEIVATNWTSMMVHWKHHWGGSTQPHVRQVRELRRNDRLVGYCCAIAPRGYVVVSVRRELPPVKAYARTCDLDPESEYGMAAYFRDALFRVIIAIESELGPIDQVSSDVLVTLLDIDSRPMWSGLEKDPDVFRQDLERGDVRIDYQESQVLLSASWDQSPPYNHQCPDLGCTYPAHCYYNTNAVVGCVATAGAQIMHYWNWPPYGEGTPYDDAYDWVNMPDRVLLDPQNCNPPIPQVNAVAELCAEIGGAVDMDYGCSGSGAPTADMEAVLEDHYRYSDACQRIDRSDFADMWDWFVRLQSLLNVNQPLQYRVPGHSLVCDGWSVVWQSGEQHPYYHVNNGHDGPDTAWYHVDTLGAWDPDEEYALERIYPDVSVGSTLSGTYPATSFPYHYIDQDAIGNGVTFEGGQTLQFLPAVVLRGNGDLDHPLRIEGVSAPAVLCYSGDTSRGARLDGAAMRLTNDGELAFSPLSRPRYPNAGALGSYEVEIAWEAGLGTPHAFEVERQTGTAGTFLHLAYVQDTHTTDLTVTPGTWYGYRIRAITYAGAASEFSDEVWVWVPIP
jgi:hypothetical protein